MRRHDQDRHGGMLDSALRDAAHQDAAQPGAAAPPYDEGAGVALLDDIEQVAPEHAAAGPDQLALRIEAGIGSAPHAILEDGASLLLDLALDLPERRHTGARNAWAGHGRPGAARNRLQHVHDKRLPAQQPRSHVDRPLRVIGTVIAEYDHGRGGYVERSHAAR